MFVRGFSRIVGFFFGANLKIHQMALIRGDIVYTRQKITLLAHTPLNHLISSVLPEIFKTSLKKKWLIAFFSLNFPLFLSLLFSYPYSLTHDFTLPGNSSHRPIPFSDLYQILPSFISHSRWT
jgi:hypothetical protein